MKRLRARYSCPVEFALDHLGGKWSTVILAHLKEAPCRYADLRRRVPGLSDKMLTERLRGLEERALIERTPEGRTHLYRLTALGESARPALDALYAWGETTARERGVAVDAATPPTAPAPAPTG